LLGKVVACECDEFLRVLFPGFPIEIEIDPFQTQAVIYKGRITSRIVLKLRNRGLDFVIWVKEGGEDSLTRERLFHLVSKRKRNYPESLDDMEQMQFTNLMKLLSLTQVLDLEEESSGVYELFMEVGKKSKASIGLALQISEEIGPMKVLYSLITFYSRILAGTETGSVSPHYAMVLKRCGERRALFEQALKTLPMFQRMKPEMLIVNLLLKVL